MSMLKPTRDVAPLNESAIAEAVALLAAAARIDFGSVEAQLKAAGFGITGYQPLQAKPDAIAPEQAASDIGTVIEGRGIYHGPWQPRAYGVIVYAYSDTDLLKEASGLQMLLAWYETRDELARRNGGRRYGDGTEPALRRALAKPAGTKDAYQDGDLVMGPQVLLNGRDLNGEKIRAQNTFDLLSGSKGDAFKNISQALRDGSSNGRWSWSCSEDRGNPSTMRAVRLSDGYDGWRVKDGYRLGVLPFRFFREPHAVKAVNHLNI